MESTSEVLKERLEKIQTLKSKIPLYPNHFLSDVRVIALLDGFEEGKDVKVAGRMTAKRLHGKSAFADLRDETGRIQLFFKLDLIGQEAFDLFLSLDLGDIIGIEGKLFLTRTGEKSIKIEKYHLLSKIVQILPEKWHGLKDVEARYRHRYIDLIMNEDARKNFQNRSMIVREIRKFMDDKGFMEVETPMMQPIPGGARAKPFVTHHEALHADLYLRVAPELYLKRLLVGGFSKVYEINRNFRNEGISTKHNPEFTMMEVYQAYADYQTMMNLVEDLVVMLIEKLHGKTELPFGEMTINFKKPWKRVRFYDALNEKSGMDWRHGNLKELAKKTHISLEHYTEDVDILNEAFDRFVEPGLVDPTFVTDYPAITTPLARRKEGEEDLVDRFELFVGHMELANAFSELNDPFEQRERLAQQKEIIGAKKETDEDFLLAMEYGMPPAGGLGIGIDRLVVLLTNSLSIREVILFPQLKPETKEEAKEE